MPRAIYADYNGTTKPGPEAREWMLKAMESWGNPSSVHRLGQEARELLDEARALVAKACDRFPKEVVFTSGGSEANTMALWGSALAQPGLRVLTSPIEHSSVRDTLAALDRLGGSFRTVKVLATGELDWIDFLQQLDEYRPHLVSLMAANNETGVMFPLPDVIREAHARGIRVHTDAVQALGKVPPSYWDGADLVSVSAHKIQGPKGVGALLVREGSALECTHFGGAQETKRRGGTENLVGICGFAGACSALSPSTPERVGALRDRFEKRLSELLEDFSIIGGAAQRLANTSNIRFPGVSSEVLLSALDLDGVYVSAGSACSAGSLKPSPVLLAMGMPDADARECVRFSWGALTTEDDVTETAALVASHVSRIRERRKA